MAWRSSETIEQEEERLSKLNAAGLINITVERLWQESYNAMANGDFILWNRKLDAIWLILGGDVTKNSDADKEYYAIETELYSTGTLNHKRVGFTELKEEQKPMMARQYLILKKKALFLRRLQNSQGKGTAYADASEDDFE